MAALPIILNILKITGIVLASVLGFVLIVVLLVLFVPIRYKARFVRTGVEGDDPVNAGGYVSWLLHLVHVSLAYPAEYVVTVRIFGIPIIRKSLNQDKDKDQGQDGAGDSGEPETENEDPAQGTSEENADTLPASQAEEEFLTHDDETDDMSGDTDEADGDTGGGSGEDSDEDSDDDVSDEDDEPKASIFSRIADLINKIKYTISNIHDKIIEIANNIHYYHNLLTSELFERTFAKCKKKVLRLLKSILPRKGDIRLEMGFDDPYTTGEVLAIAGILYPLIGEYVHIYGNFDESVIRGGGYFKGRIYLITVAMLGLFYLTDRDLKKTIRLLKKEPVKKKNHRSGRRSNGRDQ